LQTPAVKSQDDSRCQHRFRNGKRCRLPGSPSRSGLCLQHFRLQSPSDFEDLFADLLPEPSEFSSCGDIRQFLARLLILVTKGRISPRRASVLTFISCQLLHSHRAIQKELDTQPQQIIFDLPRPKLD